MSAAQEVGGTLNRAEQACGNDWSGMVSNTSNYCQVFDAIPCAPFQTLL
jgi:hypothetical protein